MLQTQKELYRKICAEHAEIPLFSTGWWMDIACNGEWDVAITYNGDQVSGVWAYPLTQKLGVSLVRNPQLTPYCGPTVIFPADLKASGRDSFEHEVIRSLMEQVQVGKAWDLALQPGLKQAGLFKEMGFDIDVRQTFIINTAEREEADLYLDLQGDLRTNINKSFKTLTIADEPEALPLLYDFQKATLNRKETDLYYSPGYMQRLFDACYQRGQCALWVARQDGNISAILWNLWDERRSWYLVGAKNPAVKDKRAMSALVWHCIRYAREQGKASFDFEGSMVPGVEKFFRAFGGNRELYLVLKKNKSLLWKAINAIR